MGYCVVADIERLGTFAGHPFAASGTRPTISDVEEIIDEYYDQINSELYASGVSVPISQSDSPYAYSLVKKLNMWGAAGEVQESAFFRMKRNDSEAKVTYLSKYRKTLEKYRNEPILLIDAVLRNTHKSSKTGESSILYSSLSDKYDSTGYDALTSIKITDGLEKGFKW